MKTVILCGGTGTRMKEETEFKPKPLVLVGGKPILWHIMKTYAHYGFNDFILALGYKGDMIKQYFLNLKSVVSDFTLHTKENTVVFHNNECDDFKITFAETGLESLTGERVRLLQKYLGDEDFMVTYGDGVGNINIKQLVDFHRIQNTLGTVTGVLPGTRFGLLSVNHETRKVKDFFQHKVTHFDELRTGEQRADYVNAGFMVLKRRALDFLEKDSMIESLLAKLVSMNELSVYTHDGRWKCMDTYKEVEEMNHLWNTDPFWKVWKS